jgi:hypothetical protein
MRKTEEREIGALKVTTIQLPATRGSRLRFKLVKLLAPALGAIGGKAVNFNDLKSMNVVELAPALVALVSQLDDAAHDALLLEMLVCTSVVRDDAGGRPIKFDLTSKAFIDQAFDGDADALWTTWMFALEVNLGGFFAASGGPAQPGPTPSD